jgi:hypothetical protein
VNESTPLGPGRHRFHGRIAGAGSTSGVRLVVGRWTDSPLGSFADVMLADRDGLRVLLAPDDRVADFVSSTYRFDRVVTGPVSTEARPGEWHVVAPGLDVRLGIGGRGLLGTALRGVPDRWATAPAWTRVTDPVSRVALRGVRTRGTAGGGRREYYGATDLHRVVSLAGTWRGLDLGDLAPVWPEPGFGFSSTPRRPGVTTLVTTIDVAGDLAARGPR